MGHVYGRFPGSRRYCWTLPTSGSGLLDLGYRPIYFLCTSNHHSRQERAVRYRPIRQGANALLSTAVLRATESGTVSVKTTCSSVGIFFGTPCFAHCGIKVWLSHIPSKGAGRAFREEFATPAGELCSFSPQRLVTEAGTAAVKKG